MEQLDVHDVLRFGGWRYSSIPIHIHIQFPLQLSWMHTFCQTLYVKISKEIFLTPFSSKCTDIFSSLENDYNLISPFVPTNDGSVSCELPGDYYLGASLIEFRRGKKIHSCYSGLWALLWASLVHCSDCQLSIRPFSYKLPFELNEIDIWRHGK
jgi:hypothetical protein